VRLAVTTPAGVVVDADDVRHVRAEDATGAFGIERVLDGMPLAMVDRFKHQLRATLAERAEATLDRIDASGELGDADRAALLAIARDIAAGVAP